MHSEGSLKNIFGRLVYGMVEFLSVLVVYLMMGGVVMAAEPAKPDCEPLTFADMRSVWVLPDVVHNGQPMTVRNFESPESLQAILKKYRLEWKRAGLDTRGPIEYEAGGWNVIAKLEGSCFYTVQVRANGLSGSKGILAVSQVQEVTKVRVLGKDFPMMYGSKVAADMKHRDPGKEARTIMLMNQFSTDANADFYRQAIGGEGWQIISDKLVTYEGGKGNAYALTFKRGLNETTVVISRAQSGTSVFASLIDKP